MARNEMRSEVEGAQGSMAREERGVPAGVAPAVVLILEGASSGMGAWQRVVAALRGEGRRVYVLTR